MTLQKSLSATSENQGPRIKNRWENQVGSSRITKKYCDKNIIQSQKIASQLIIEADFIPH